MSTDAKSALHDLFRCPLPGRQDQGSIFSCECGRKWGSDGFRWIILAGTEANIARPFAVPDPEPIRSRPHTPQARPVKGPCVSVAIDRMRLIPGMHRLQLLVHDTFGEQWTLTLHVDRIAKGDQMQPLTGARS